MLFIYVSFVMMFSFCSANHKQNHKSKQMKSESHFYSEVFTSSNLNGKPESHIRKVEFEEFRDKNNDEPEKIRKYGEIIKKDNDSKAEVIKKASSNVEKEGMILSKSKEKTTLDKEEEKKVLPEIDFGKKFNLFRNMKNDFGFINFDDDDYFRRDFDEEFKNSKFSSFLREKKKRLLHRQ